MNTVYSYDNELKKQRRLYRLLITWLDYNLHGSHIADYFNEKNYRKIVLCGNKDIAELLQLELNDPSVNVTFIQSKQLFDSLNKKDANSEALLNYKPDILIFTEKSDLPEKSDLAKYPCPVVLFQDIIDMD